MFSEQIEYGPDCLQTDPEPLLRIPLSSRQPLLWPTTALQSSLKTTQWAEAADKERVQGRHMDLTYHHILIISFPNLRRLEKLLQHLESFAHRTPTSHLELGSNSTDPLDF